MAIQRRRSYARRPQAESQSAKSLETMMNQIWPMLLMGMQYRQRAGETAAGRAHSADQARKSRLFQAQQAQQRQDWAQAERDEALAQRAREYAGGQIGPTTGPDELASITTQAAQRFPGADIGELSMLPQRERVQAALGQVAGIGGGEASDPGYLPSVASKYHLGPLQEIVEPQHGPIRPPEVTQALGRPPDALLSTERETWETPAGTALRDAMEGRRAALIGEMDYDAQRAGLTAEATAQGQLPSALIRQADQARHGLGAQAHAAELAEQTQARTPTEVEYTGVGIPYPGGQDVYLKTGDQYQLVHLHQNWTGSLLMLPEQMPGPADPETGIRPSLSVVTAIRPEGDPLTPEQAGLHEKMIAGYPDRFSMPSPVTGSAAEQAITAAQNEEALRILEDAQALDFFQPSPAPVGGVQRRQLFPSIDRPRR